MHSGERRRERVSFSQFIVPWCPASTKAARRAPVNPGRCACVKRQRSNPSAAACSRIVSRGSFLLVLPGLPVTLSCPWRLPGSFHLQVKTTPLGTQLNSVKHFDFARFLKIENALEIEIDVLGCRRKALHLVGKQRAKRRPRLDAGIPVLGGGLCFPAHFSQIVQHG